MKEQPIMPREIKHRKICRLADLSLTEADYRALRRQGTVCSECRGGRVYFKLRFRTEDGQQRVRYIGNDPAIAESIRGELRGLQLHVRQLANLEKRDAQARNLLRQVKRDSANAIEAIGCHFHGFAIRKRSGGIDGKPIA